MVSAPSVAASGPPSRGAVAPGRARARHLRLLAWNALSGAIRGGSGVVFLFFALSFGLIVAHLVMEPLEMGKEYAKSQGIHMERDDVMRELIGIARPVVEWFVAGGGVDDLPREERETREKDAKRWSAHLLDAKPALLSAILLVMLYGLPFVVATGAFNQFAGDIQHRGLRYLLLRTERSNLYFGRFIGMCVLVLATMAILSLTIGLYMGLKLRVYPGGDLALWSLHGLMAMACVSLPYVAMCSWISASFDSPFTSLTVSSLALILVPGLAFWASSQWELAWGLIYVSPWWLHASLLHPDPERVAAAVVGCLFYTGAYLAIGHRAFTRRDL